MCHGLQAGAAEEQCLQQHVQHLPERGWQQVCCDMSTDGGRGIVSEALLLFLLFDECNHVDMTQMLAEVPFALLHSCASAPS